MEICWTIELEQEFIKLWNTMSIRKMAEHFNTTRYIIQTKAKQLGLEQKKPDKWTEEEEKLLIEYSKKYLAKTIAKRLGRSYESVKQKAKRMGIELKYENDIWKKWMVDYLKDNVNKRPMCEIEKMLGLSYRTIIRKCEELNLEIEDDTWTEEEISILKEYAPKCHYKELVKLLPNRSVSAINTRAHILGIELITDYYKLNDETAKYIKENWGKISIKDLARNLKVSTKIIYRYKKELNLPDINKKTKWNEENIEKLRQLSKEMTIDELAKYFKTTNGTITTIAYNEDISLIHSTTVWTEEKISLLKELAQSLNIEEISNIMNISTSSIRNSAKRNNILIQNKTNIWTEENSSELISLINQGKSLIEIVIIMDKNDRLIIKKAKELNIDIKVIEKEWTKEEIEELIILSETMTIDELVKKFKRTSSSIRKQAKKNNIIIINDRKLWTEEEERKLEKLFLIDKKTPKEIALILNRTEDAIIVKIKKKGLKIQNGKRAWTKEEEELLTDLWGTVSIERIAKKLNRTTSSIKNKVSKLGLGSSTENNYEGLKIQEICDLLNVDRMIVDVLWYSLGLKIKKRKISEKSSYMYVEIKDLFEFLKNNQNIWDSRNLEIDILGKEPEWLKEKRKKDINKPEIMRLELMKQQLIIANKYYLNNQNEIEEPKIQKRG